MFGVDVDDRKLMAARSWPWLEGLILGLFDKPKSRLTLKIYPPAKHTDDEGAEGWR